MAYIPSECSIQEYENQIYSGESKHRLYIKHGSTVIGTNGDENASPFASKLTWTRRILDNGKNSFSLDNFVSQEIELELHDYIIYNLDEEIEIKIGTYIPSIDDYVYVPLGIYKIQDNPTNDKDKTTYKLRDRSVNFDFNYNAKDLIESNSGKATKGQILQDICQKANVKFVGNENFIGYNDPIGIYDSSISARVYISYIAEQTGCIATIDRNGDLIFVQISEDLDKKELPYNLLESYTVGERFQIGKIEYESGVIKYEKIPSATVEGESIRIDNATENALKELTIEGKSEQKTRSGKNLVKIVDSSRTINGITFVVNEDKSITINGTSTDTVYQNLNISYNDSALDNYFTLKKDTTYTSYLFKSNKNAEISMTTRTQSQNTALLKVAVGETIKIQTYSGAEDKKAWSFLTIASGKTFNNVTVYPMIIEGRGLAGVLEEFEPYGASPSPDYPSEIESIGHTNLFSSEMELGSILGTGELQENENAIRTKDFIRIEANTKYYIKNDKGYAINLYYYDEKEEFIISGSTSSGEFTTPSNAYYFKTRTNTGSVQNDLTAKYILSKIPITFDYIPYGKYGIEVKTTGKNLANINDGLKTPDDVYNWHVGNVEPNKTYSLFVKVKDGEAVSLNLRYLSDNKVIDSRAGASKPRVYKFSSNRYDVVYFECFNHGSYSFTGFEEVMLVEGNYTLDTIGEYEPYQCNTSLLVLNEPLRSLPNGVKDIAYIKNNKLYVERKVGSILLNGSEEWGRGSMGYYIEGTLPTFSNKKTDSYDFYCNLFKTNNNSTTWTEKNYCGFSSTNTFWIRDDFEIATTIDEFKTWLSTHNAQVDYELETPIVEELSEVESFMLHEGVNNITNDYNALMTLQYYIKEEGKKTLYLSSANPYINSQYTLDQIFPKVKDFYLDSLEVSRILGNPTIDVYDIIYVEYTNEDRETISYRTLAQGVLTFSGTMTQNFETKIEYSESQSNVSINGEQVFKKSIKSQVDNIEATLTTTIQKTGEIEGAIINFENRFTQSIEGLENILSSAGGNNYVRDSMGALNDGSWTNVDTILDTFTRTYAVGQSAIMLNKTTPNENEEEGRPIKQKINCKNGTYTLSFDYYRLIPLSVCKIIINENEYELTNYDELTKFKETFSVLTNEVNIEFVSDTNNSCYILNLILNDGVDVLNWSQNTNETITDTVKIGKGIQVESNIANTLWRADADGSRVFNKTTGAIVREDTARGTITNELESKGTSKINGLLVLKTNNQIWLSGV